MDLHYKQEVAVGTLVILGVALFIWGSMWLGGRSFSRAPLVTISFRDAGTLKTGSPVRVSGVLLGNVHGIEYQDYGKVLVRIRLDPRVKPRRDASAQLSTVGLVADAVINLKPGMAPEPLPADAVIIGTVDLGLVALGTELGSKAKEVMTGLTEIANKKLADDLSRTLGAIHRMANLYGDSTRGPSAELIRTLAKVQRMGDRLDSTLSALKLGRTVEHADSLMGSLSRLAADARTTASRLDSVIAKVNRGEGTLGKFATDTAFYTNAQAAIKALQEFVDDLRKHPGKLGITVRVF